MLCWVRAWCWVRDESIVSSENVHVYMSCVHVVMCANSTEQVFVQDFLPGGTVGGDISRGLVWEELVSPLVHL